MLKYDAKSHLKLKPTRPLIFAAYTQKGEGAGSGTSSSATVNRKLFVMACGATFGIN